MFSRFVAGLFLLFIALSAFGGDLRDNEMIIGGGNCEVDGLWISGPSVYLRRNTPGVVVGMAQAPGKNRCYAYVLVIKGDHNRKVLARYDSRSNVSGPVAGSRGFVEIANKTATFEYKVEIDPTGKQPPREMLSINGQALDIGKGRVVLIDVSAEEVSWKQALIDLPKFPTWPTQTAQVEAQAKNMVDLLRRGKKEVRDFLN